MKNPSGATKRRGRPLADERREGHVDLAAGAGLVGLDLQPEGARGSFRVREGGGGNCIIGGIDELSETRGRGHQLTQEPQPFSKSLTDKEVDPGRVAAGPGKAGDKTELDRVLIDAEDDRNRLGGSLGRERRVRVSRRRDRAHLTLDEIGRQFRNPVIAAFRPTILDGDITTLDIPGLRQALTKRCKSVLHRLAGRYVAEKANYWNGLLRA